MLITDRTILSKVYPSFKFPFESRNWAQTVGVDTLAVSNFFLVDSPPKLLSQFELTAQVR